MLLEPSEIRKKQNGNGGEKKKRKLRKSEWWELASWLSLIIRDFPHLAVIPPLDLSDWSWKITPPSFNQSDAKRKTNHDLIDFLWLILVRVLGVRTSCPLCNWALAFNKTVLLLLFLNQKLLDLPLLVFYLPRMRQLSFDSDRDLVSSLVCFPSD